MINKLLKKIKHIRICRLNRYNCPECIYHEWIWEGAIFRGNRCKIFRGEQE